MIPDSSNIALKKIARQSSTVFPYNAHKAVDGKPDTDLESGSCAQTNNTGEQYWVVFLSQEYLVAEVVITNRGDCCGTSDSSSFPVFIPVFLLSLP